MVSYIEMCQEVSQDVFDLLIHLFGTRRVCVVAARLLRQLLHHYLTCFAQLLSFSATLLLALRSSSHCHGSSPFHAVATG